MLVRSRKCPVFAHRMIRFLFTRVVFPPVHRQVREFFYNPHTDVFCHERRLRGKLLPGDRVTARDEWPAFVHGTQTSLPCYGRGGWCYETGSLTAAEPLSGASSSGAPGAPEPSPSSGSSCGASSGSSRGAGPPPASSGSSRGAGPPPSSNSAASPSLTDSDAFLGRAFRDFALERAFFGDIKLKSMGFCRQQKFGYQLLW